MKALVRHSAFLALIGLTLSPLAHASPSPDDSAPFDYEQWRRDHPLPAGKRLAALNVGEPRTVRMIYFLPNDRPFRQGVVDEMKTMIRRVQTFYADQMQAHGYGNTTFRFETDAQGEPLVHRVDGQYPDQRYLQDDTASKVLEEIDIVFDIGANIYLIFIETREVEILSNGQGALGVGGRTTKNGGFALLGWRSGSFGTVAHEIGHAFGLKHDFRDGAYVMSYSEKERLSACSAGFLAVHPYFSPNSPIRQTASPRIKPLSPLAVQIGDATSVPIQNKVSDSNGLHQVSLYVITKAPHLAAGLFETKACRGLEGEKEAVVEFDYDGTIPSLRRSSFENFDKQLLVIEAVDFLGNTAFSKTFELINTTFKAPTATLTLGRKSGYYFTSFSPDSQLLASGGDAIRLWDVATGGIVATLGHEVGAYSVSFSPDGRLLATGGGAVRLWDIATRKLITTMGGRERPVAFSPDGRLLASGGVNDYLVKLWNVKSGELIASLSGHFGTISSVTFSPDGRLLASASVDGEVKLWDVSGDTDGEYIGTFFGHSHRSGVYSVAFSPNGRLLASGENGVLVTEAGVREQENPVVKLWNESTRRTIATLSGRGPVSFSPDGSLLASGGFDDIRIWDVVSGEMLVSFPALSNVSTVSFSPDGRVLASGEVGGLINLFDLSKWTQLSSTRTEVPLPHSLTKVSGDNQQGPVGTALAEPFVVSVLTEDDEAIAGVAITFSVTTGGGTLSATTATTDASGRARSILTLGSDPGTNTVTATVEGLEPEIFTAIGQAPADPDDGEVAFGFVGQVEDQSYTAGTAITPLVLPEATGGEGEVTYRVFGLPAGLSFDATTRTTSGTPEAATDGAVEVTYTAQDSAGVAVTLSFSITVNPALSFGDLFDLFGGG